MPGRLSVSFLLERSREEISRRSVCAHPDLPHQEIMNVIGEDEFLKPNMVLTQTLSKVHGLIEGDITIMIAMNQQHGRPTSCQGGVGRRFKRQLLHSF